jgi:hypothetical protein
MLEISKMMKLDKTLKIYIMIEIYIKKNLRIIALNANVVKH